MIRGMNTNRDHILKSYDSDLNKLKTLVLDMMNVNLQQLNLLHSLFSSTSQELRQSIIDMDTNINGLDSEIIQFSLQIFSLRNPVAYDLRVVFSASHISRNLERIGDYAKNISKYLVVSEIPNQLKSDYLQAIHILIEMTHLVIEGYRHMDVDLAKKVRDMDKQVDALYNKMSDYLLSKIQIVPEKMTEIRAHFLLVRNIERIGDHIVNLYRYIDFIENNSVIYDD